MSRPLDTDLVLDGVCSYYRIDMTDLLGFDRRRRLVTPRHLAMRFLRDQEMTLEEIGHEFGRDHTSVMHALRALDKRLTAAQIDEVWRYVKAYHDERVNDV